MHVPYGEMLDRTVSSAMVEMLSESAFGRRPRARWWQNVEMGVRSHQARVSTVGANAAEQMEWEQVRM